MSAFPTRLWAPLELCILSKRIIHMYTLLPKPKCLSTWTVRYILNILLVNALLSSPLEKLGKQLPVLSYSSFASIMWKVKINSIKLPVVQFKGICQLGAVHTKTYLCTWQKIYTEVYLKTWNQRNLSLTWTMQNNPGLGTQRTLCKLSTEWSRAAPTSLWSPHAHPFRLGRLGQRHRASWRGGPSYLARAGAVHSPGPPDPGPSRPGAGGRWRLDWCSDPGSRSERRRRRNSPPQPTGGAEGPWPPHAPCWRSQRRSFLTSLPSQVSRHLFFTSRWLMTRPQRPVVLTSMEEDRHECKSEKPATPSPRSSTRSGVSK